ncbi:hypothetical protein [Shewanella aestuarii]|uniref:MSHA biogenesis protein MshF n=1 Tax=Shewanella aestuarii TaxID=1028752 RepID=A0A6G9QFW9_9GAMM|nr:hypothetical protein [Shewanella aestuarii]QIR13366.1 hypothetical protein HBH39_01705 [Shewanella aestuarii]
MLRQQKADDDLLKVYGRILALVVLLLVLGVLGFRHFNTVPTLVGQSFAMEHNRLLNILAMVKSQWLSTGRPDKILLNWQSMAPNVLKTLDEDIKANKKSNVGESDTNNAVNLSRDFDSQLATGNWISLSKQGWPVLETLDVKGCERLWYQLLVSPLKQVNVSYDAEIGVCRFIAPDSTTISYQTTSGRVIFLANTHNLSN